MPVATMQPDGTYVMEYEDGSTATVPADVAQQQSPESFPEPEVDLAPYQYDAAVNADPMQVPEPTKQDLDSYMAQQQQVSESPTFTPPVGPELSFSEDEAGVAYTAPDPASQSRSQSRSMSVSGTRPHAREKIGSWTAPVSIDDHMAQLAASNQMRREGVAQEYAAEDIHLAEQERLHAEAAQYRTETVAEQQRMHEVSMEAAQEAEQRLTEQRQQMSRMDMNKIWKDTPYAAKFAGLMSAGIAGWLSPTGKNSVIEQMSQLVDQSLREQQANMQLEQNQYTGSERAMGRMEDRMRDSELRYTERRALLMGNLADQFKMESEKYGSAITKAKLLQSSAAMDMEASKMMQDVRNMNYQQIHQGEVDAKNEQHQRAVLSQRRNEFKISRADRLAEAKAKARADAGGADKFGGRQLIGTFDGKRLYAGEGVTVAPGEMEKVRDKIKTENQLAATLKTLQVLIGKNPGRKLTPDSRAQVDSLIAEVNLAMRPITGANFTEAEAKDLKKFFGSPNALMQSPEMGAQILSDVIRRAPTRIAGNVSVYDPQWYGGDQQIDLGDGQVLDVPVWEGYDTGAPLGPSLTGVTFANAQDKAIGDFVNDVDAAMKSYSVNSSAGNTALADEAKRQAGLKAIQLAQQLGEWQVGSDNEPLRDAALAKITEAERLAGVDEGSFLRPSNLGRAVSTSVDEQPAYTGDFPTPGGGPDSQEELPKYPGGWSQ